MEENGDGKDVEFYGVLLYYKYTSIPDVASLAQFYDTHCRSLDLSGRIRIGFDGVNATIGGKFPALEQHIELMRSNSLFDATDFKLAQCGHPSNENIARECGFTSLSVRVVKELVTFRSGPLLKSPAISNAGKHLSATEFHYFLQQAANCATDGNALDCQAKFQNEDLVLLDARNVYETRIGKFKTASINALDPEIRQYSDLASWIDKHSDRLRNKNVLMYCTGGIRCEMASAYIRSKGAGFENVFQLFGGIQRYLEQFPDGGYFKGKNFVFDHRISVGSCNMEVLGTCLLCGFPFDDYSSRSRCSYCRMLVLVCYSCQGIYTEKYVCELCQKQGNGEEPISHGSFDFDAAAETEAEALNSSFASPHLELSNGSVSDHRRKLRILCLHGFRQNASSLKGRTSSLSKKLKNYAEFIFIDAPHELPLIYQPTKSCAKQNSPLSSENSKRRFAWLISPNSSPSSSSSSDENSWRIADQQFDPLQYKLQTEGFEASNRHLQDLISRMGPFDGILGFSQGAAMAALYCKEQQRRRVSDIKFAVLCSGYSAASNESVDGFIECPSLHVYGSGGIGRDRQINPEASRELADLFDKNSSVTIEHDMGHIIPTKSPYIDQIKAFLVSFF